MILNHLKKIGFIVSFSFVLGFVSCHSSQELMEPKASAKTKKQKRQLLETKRQLQTLLKDQPKLNQFKSVTTIHTLGRTPFKRL